MMEYYFQGSVGGRNHSLTAFNKGLCLLLSAHLIQVKLPLSSPHIWFLQSNAHTTP